MRLSIQTTGTQLQWHDLGMASGTVRAIELCRAATDESTGGYHTTYIHDDTASLAAPAAVLATVNTHDAAFALSLRPNMPRVVRAAPEPAALNTEMGQLISGEETRTFYVPTRCIRLHPTTGDPEVWALFTARHTEGGGDRTVRIDAASGALWASTAVRLGLEAISDTQQGDLYLPLEALTITDRRWN